MSDFNVKTRAQFSAANFLIQSLAAEMMMHGRVYPPERVYEGKRFRLVSVVPPDEFTYEEVDTP